MDQGKFAVLQVVRLQVGEQRLHRGEDAIVVCGGGEHDVAAPERLGEDDGGMRGGGVIHRDIPNAQIRQPGGQDIGGILRMAVDGAVGDHDSRLLRAIAAPAVVFFHKFGDIRTPNRAVQRADHGELQPRGLLEQRLHLRAVLADDVGVIAARIVHPVAVKVDLVRIQVAVHRAKGTERIGRVEDLLRGVIGDHDLRPVHHRCHDKGECVPAGGEYVALLDRDGVGVERKVIKLPDHGHGLGVPDDLERRIAEQQLTDNGAVVGLHVVDDQIVERPPAEHMGDILQEQIRHGAVNGVEQNRLLIHHQIGVVGHAARDRVHILKKGQPAIRSADPIEVLLNLLDTIH